MEETDDEANGIVDAVYDSIPEYPKATSRVDGDRYVAFTKIGDVIFRGESDLGEKHATRNLMDRVSEWKRWATSSKGE